MRRLRLIVLSTTFLGLAAPAASALPMPGVSGSTTMAVTPVAMGCGPGRSRDSMGLCRHEFNRFKHHEHFQAYERRHCTAVSTPNGMVKRCRI